MLLTASAIVPVAAANTIDMRPGASSAWFADGRVLIAGGVGPAGPVAFAEIYSNGRYTPAAAMSTARANAGVAALKDGRILVTGGISAGGDILSSAEVYDSFSNSWSVVPSPLIEPRTGHIALLLGDGRVVLAGGESGRGISQSIEVFDPSSSTFGFAGTLSAPRKNHAAAVLEDGRVLIVGGSFGGLVPSASSDIFNPETNMVSPGPRLLIGRTGHSATTLANGNILIAGGNDGLQNLDSAEIYDVATGVFHSTGSLHFPRSGHSAFLLSNGDVLIISGGTAAELYQLETGTFVDGVTPVEVLAPVKTTAGTEAILVNTRVDRIAGSDQLQVNAVPGCGAAPASGVIDLTSTTACAQDPAGVVLRTSGFSGSTGTGVFQPFVRLQKNATQRGYNTGGTLEFDEMSSSNFTHDMALGAVPVITVDGTPYRQFRLDINQKASDPLLSLDVLRIYLHNTANITGYNPATGTFASPATEIWELDPDSYVKLNYSNFPGSGNGDMELLIPNSLFTGCAGTCYVTLYSEFGSQFPANDGFEEWSVFKQVTLEAFKTVNASFDRTYNWTIHKSAAPSTWNLFKGDSGTSAYDVTVDASSEDNNYGVTGTISLINGSGGDVRVQTGNTTDTIGFVSLSAIDGAMTAIGSATISNCNTGILTNPGGNTLPAGQTFQCDYTFTFLGAPSPVPVGSILANRVTFVTGTGGGTPVSFTEIFSFSGDPTSLQNQVVHITDKFGAETAVELGSLDAAADTLPHTFHPGDRTFSCDTDGGTHTNTAKIVETGQTDTASVTVNCHALTVTKDAATSRRREWEWSIEKSADQSSLQLSANELLQVNYQVTVNAQSTDSLAVTGKITVDNPAPIDAILTGITDSMTSDLTATVSCGSISFPYTLAAGTHLDCTYSRTLPNEDTRTNTATATLQNHSFDSAGVPIGNGTTGFSGTADVSFASPTTEEIDECVDVNDIDKGSLGIVCAASGLPHAFNYGLFFGARQDADVLLQCGNNEHRNVASFKTNDTKATGEDDVTVNASLSCDAGCTFTPGYWRTHNVAFHGGARPDDSWLSIGASAENTIFFVSGKTYYQVLWTPPAGNAYYNLSFQYIAAQLNQLSGAATPSAVQSAFATATLRFQAYTPAQIGSLKGNNLLRQEFITLAGILGAYNSGITGPGHCPQDGLSPQ